MGSLRFNDYSDSPTIFVPPHNQTFGPLSHQSHQQPTQAFQQSISHRSQWKPSASRPVCFTNPSYKRSRDEVENEPPSPSAISSFTPKFQEEPVEYGEGMTLISPTTGRAISAESQTGTWYEENLEIERQASIKAAEPLAQAAQDRASRPKKSLRIDSLPTPSLSAFAKESEDAHLRPRAIDGPVSDSATHLLGVGWKLICQEDDTQAAAKGWAKYINNHYPSITNAQLLLKSEGHQAYLVKATSAGEEVESTEGFFLFAEDLNEGRLVAKTWDTCIPKLQTSPINFEGEEGLRAVRIPPISHSTSMEEMRINEPVVTVSTMKEETTNNSAQEGLDGAMHSASTLEMNFDNSPAPVRSMDPVLSMNPVLSMDGGHSNVSAQVGSDEAMDLD